MTVRLHDGDEQATEDSKAWSCCARRIEHLDNIESPTV